MTSRANQQSCLIGNLVPRVSPLPAPGAGRETLGTRLLDPNILTACFSVGEILVTHL